MSQEKKIAYVNLLLVNKGKVLMQLRDNKPEIFAPGIWAIPGGRVDEGESSEEAVAREFMEETSYSVNPKYFDTYVYDFIEGNPLAAFYWDTYDGVSPVECYEGQKMEFLPLESIKKLETFPIHKKVVEDLFKYLDKDGFGDKRDYTEEELDELEDELIEEEFEQREEKMSVDGRSVFEIDRIKRKKEDEENQKES